MYHHHHHHHHHHVFIITCDILHMLYNYQKITVNFSEKSALTSQKTSFYLYIAISDQKLLTAVSQALSSFLEQTWTFPMMLHSNIQTTTTKAAYDKIKDSQEYIYLVTDILFVMNLHSNPHDKQYFLTFLALFGHPSVQQQHQLWLYFFTAIISLLLLLFCEIYQW